ncbi:Glucokinase [Saliniradius amylolyticus]|uniref:Glucokinase n=1 Tax=Saliniradius amylolyticus TaxID=2183582 RepID=A0A2S2E2X0_9ALTE|nr:ROK family protein [Saliniradius amylolyticus]AWL11984.1 Glucokinase [Saliniradius amylolyticus]
MNQVIGIDIGGTKVRGACFDKALTPSHMQQLPANAAEGREAVLEAINKLLTELFAVSSTPVKAIGISSAGIIDPATGVVIDATDAIPGWSGTPLTAEVEKAFNIPAVAVNDVKAALLGELSANNALQQGRCFMLTLGTGLGGALAEQGQIVHGRHQLAGHIGRTRLPHPWKPSEWLTLDRLVSGSGLAFIANQLASEALFADGKAVTRALDQGNHLASQAIELFCQHLAATIENLYWLLDPDAIVIGGGLIDARQYWWSQVQERLQQRDLDINLQVAQLANDAGAVGAAKLALQSIGIRHVES